MAPVRDRASSRTDGALGALLGTFVGDALGAPFEGAPALSAPEPLELEEARLGRGTYTDDTEMAIALAEVLIERDECDEDVLAAQFLAQHDPRRGYGAGTLQVFALWRRGVAVSEAASRVFRGGSYGNGAAMRVAPVGVRFADEPERLVREAARSARVTHAHRQGIAGAVAQASAVGAALRGDDPLAAAREAAGTPELRLALDVAATSLAEKWSPLDAAAVFGTESSALRSLPAALYASARAESFEEACTFAVRMGGDTDTIGAMAGAVAGARFGGAAIPRRWLGPLEDGVRGRSYVEELARQLVPAADHSAAAGQEPLR
jgi:poly(ADP-ribose) glycohydrolase ARH3